MTKRQLLSIIIPIHNEAENIPLIQQAIDTQIKKLAFDFEILYVDDGSTDGSLDKLERLRDSLHHVRLLEFSRNFGKEAAVTAGLHAARGDAAIMIDADLQHPPKLLSKFIDKWQAGADLVIGIKSYHHKEGWFKRFSSRWFYRLFRLIASTDVIPHATDYRLLDRCVLDAFNSFTERDRMARGLIDWLGFRRDYVSFEAPPRQYGHATYNVKKLFSLAFNSFTAHSLVPLKLAGYIGAIILLFTGPLGLFIYIEKFILNDPLQLQFTNAALLAVLNLFLVGIILFCLGLVALYVARIHTEVTNRPLYIVRNRAQPHRAEEVNEV